MRKQHHRRSRPNPSPCAGLSMIQNWVFACSLFLLEARGQVGDLCACQPSFYDFELDFSLSCANNSFVTGPGTGIVDSVCLENGRDDDFEEENFNFAVVQLIQVFELSQILRPLPNQTNLLGTFTDGFRFNYTSLIATSNIETPSNIPRAIQINMLGNNTDNREIQVSWSLFYSNNCSIFPVIEPIQTTVATELTNVVDPPQSLCPLVSRPPSLSPTVIQPTEVPSLEPTAQPTEVPQVGVNLCGCQPGSWEFTFDFGLTCEDSTFGPPGVVDFACIVTGIPIDIVTNLQFEVVDLATILEINRNRVAVNQQQQVGPFFDGDKISYTSLLDRALTLNATTLPVQLQMVLLGRNAENQQVRLSWSAAFDDTCTVFPVVTTSDQTGSTNVTSVTDPPPKFCSLISEAPSTFPTLQPTPIPGNPTESPTLLPTQSPTLDPTSLPPTLAPTPLVTEPTQAPTFAPIPVDPTESPTSPPTLAPTPLVSAPTQTPTFVPTPVDPTEFPTLAPTPLVTEPTENPTSEPTKVNTPEPTRKPTPSKQTKAPSPEPTLKPTQRPRPKPTPKPTLKPAKPAESCIPTYPPIHNMMGKKGGKGDSDKNSDSGKKRVDDDYWERRNVLELQKQSKQGPDDLHDYYEKVVNGWNDLGTEPDYSPGKTSSPSPISPPYGKKSLQTDFPTLLCPEPSKGKSGKNGEMESKGKAKGTDDGKLIRQGKGAYYDDVYVDDDYRNHNYGG